MNGESVIELLAVLLGGGAGAVLRFWVDTRLKARGLGRRGHGWSALARLTLINALGSALLGVVLALVLSGALGIGGWGDADFGWTMYAPLSEAPADVDWSTVAEAKNFTFADWWSLLFPLLGLGVCGGFTTFSTAMVEAFAPDGRAVVGAPGFGRRLGALIGMAVLCVLLCAVAFYVTLAALGQPPLWSA